MDFPLKHHLPDFFGCLITIRVKIPREEKCVSQAFGCESPTRLGLKNAPGVYFGCSFLGPDMDFRKELDVNHSSGPKVFQKGVDMLHCV